MHNQAIAASLAASPEVLREMLGSLMVPMTIPCEHQPNTIRLDPNFNGYPMFANIVFGKEKGNAN